MTNLKTATTQMRQWLRQHRRRLRGGWDRFWFRGVDPTLVGLIRIATGLMLMYTHAVWGMRLHDFFGSNSWQPPEIVHELQQGQFQFSYLWFVSDEHLMAVHVLAFFALAAFTFGFLTRLSSVLASVIVISYLRRQPAAGFGLDLINSFLTYYLAIGYLFTPVAARALSLDRYFWRWRRLRRGERCSTDLPSSRSANVTLRLIQIQMCIVYLFAGLAKLRGDAWWNGDAMWLALSNDEYANSLSMLWTWRHPILLSAATHATIFWEISFVGGIWNRRLRPFYLAMGVLMHLGIAIFLSMWTFGLIMIVGCASFVSTEAVAAFVRRMQGPRGRNTESDPPRGKISVAFDLSTNEERPPFDDFADIVELELELDVDEDDETIFNVPNTVPK